MSNPRRWGTTGAGIILAWVLATWPSTAQRTRGEEQSSPLISRQVLAFDAELGKLFAVEPTRNAVAVLGIAGSRKEVAVGAAPVALAVNAKTRRVYIANGDSGTVSVLNAETNAIVRTIEVGSRPYALAVDESTDQLLVSNTFSNTLTVIDGTTGSTRHMDGISADAIEIDEHAGKAYLLGYEDPSIAVVDLHTLALSRMAAGDHGWGLALASGTLYLTRAGAGALYALATATGRQHVVRTGALPCAVALAPALHRAYVANYGDGSITVVDTSTFTRLSTIVVGGRPQALLFDAGTHRLFVADMQADRISVIDAESNRVARTLSAPGHPYALSLGSTPGEVYAATLEPPYIIAVRAQR